MSSANPERGILPTVLIIHPFSWDRLENRNWNLGNNFIAAGPSKFGRVWDKNLYIGLKETVISMILIWSLTSQVNLE